MNNFFSIEKLRKYKTNNAIIYRESTLSELIYSFEDVCREVESIISNLCKLKIPRHSKIGIKIDHSPALICTIISILNMSCVFFSLKDVTNKDLIQNLKVHKSVYIFDEQLHEQNDSQLHEIVLKVFNKSIFFYEYREISNEKITFPKVCFSIQTSGTTGLPKIVNVPTQSIFPNIESLMQILSIKSSDVIFLSSPPTFDPFVVDLFLFLTTGATLLITTYILKVQPCSLMKVLFPEGRIGTTILQMTPSMLMRFSLKDLKETMFSRDSTLRCLLLGGEPFPNLELIKSLQNWQLPNPKRIFNIYGITEVSCWSSIEEITPSIDKVSLGNPIDEYTFFEIRNSESQRVVKGKGELYICSTYRKCLINDENKDILDNGNVCYRNSGDIVSVGDDGKLYYYGRSNEIIKRYGCKVNLKKVEDTIRLHKTIKNACCVIDSTSNKIILAVILNEKSNRPQLSELNLLLRDQEKLDDIIYFRKFPISLHGKVLKKRILSLWKISTAQERNIKLKNIAQKFQEEIFHNLSFKEDYSRTDEKISSIWNLSFIGAGGTSMQALSIANSLEEYMGRPLPEVIGMLLNSEIIMLDLLTELERKYTSCSCLSTLRDEEKINSSKKISLNIKWKYNLGKCVDATPTLYQKNEKIFISVGSHSGILANIDGETGNLISRLELPDRIMGSVTFCQNTLGVIGCYNGFIYKFNVETSAVEWSFDSGGAIKCKPLIIDNYVFFGNYAIKNNFYCITLDEGILNWSIKIGTKPILSSPIKLDNNFILVSTLEGIITKIDYKSSSIIWSYDLRLPIFSTPGILCQKYILTAVISGQINAFDFNGNMIWTYKAQGAICSSFETVELENSTLIIFGCHDWKVYCLSYSHTERTITIVWKLEMPSQVFASPAICNFGDEVYIISCCTKGLVKVCHLETGFVVSELQLCAEIYSSPVVHNNIIYVGCRDNNLYCINLKIKNY